MDLLCTSLTRGNGIPQVTAGEVADVMVLASVEDSDQSPLAMLIQCKSPYNGFSASSRSLNRAARSTSRFETSDRDRFISIIRCSDEGSWPPPLNIILDHGFADLRDPAWKRPERAWTHIDRRSAAEKSVGCPAVEREPLDLATQFLALGAALVVGDARLPVTHIAPAVRVSAALVRALFELAMVARSLAGLARVPAPAEAPGEIVRAHPRSPRAPALGSVLVTFWRSGGVLSTA
ncbi:hypothetical protein [Virgisporangium aurantiacum]|uniref:hypothetical protein n=1 Tax=Virgisporangium aurantiacum TaxID=175570 RepID=UPI00194DCACB|nr:hypothetical protein [Virgisporangium aurantiacum]